MKNPPVIRTDRKGIKGEGGWNKRSKEIVDPGKGAPMIARTRGRRRQP